MANKNYQQLKTELEEIVEWFESSPPNLDKALEKYKQAQKCISELRSYLDDAELKVSKAKSLKDSN